MTADTERARVIEYYEHCRNDYRILWRTDETGSIHFGFFDSFSAEPWSVAAFIGGAARAVVAIAATIAAAGAAALPLQSARAAAVRWLRVAARGRAARHDAAQARMTDECASACRIRPGDRVLDAGCGVGGPARRLASQYGARVHGINVQAGHLRDAQRTIAPGTVRFSAQDFTQMALRAETFDVVWALESLCHCAQKDVFIGEALRVLRPGGRLMVADFFRAREERLAEHEPAMEAWTRGWALPDLATVPGFMRELRARGFADAQFRDIGAHVLPSSRRLYKASLVAIPIHAVLERARARSAIQGANVLAAYHQYRTLRARAWTYGIFVAVK